MRPMHSALTITLAALCASGAPAVLRAQGGFEGVITFRTSSDEGKTGTLVQTSKGHKVKFVGLGSEDSEGGAMIVDGDAKSMTMLSPREHKAVVMTQQDMEQMSAMMGGLAHKPQAKPSDFKVNFSPAGRSETVAGVKCEVWHGYTVQEGERHEGEVCLANGVGFALFDMMANNPMMRGNKALSPEFEQFKSLLGGGKGILKITKIEKGQSSTELEATNIERKSVSDAEFKAPPGYQVETMGDMMKQMGAAMKRMQDAQPPSGKPPR